MLITFPTKAHVDITMFGDIATMLRKMMGTATAEPPKQPTAYGLPPLA